MSIQNVSFEFFPPQTNKGFTSLMQAFDALKKHNPSYYSVTYGAGGSTRDNTFEGIRQLLSKNVNVAPHLACIGDNKTNIHSILSQYQSQGIKKIVALRGDAPSGTVYSSNADFSFAIDLVRYIREIFQDTFEIAVAAYPECHPQSPSVNEELMFFKEKVQAGADYAITQYFYNIHAFENFKEQCDKLNIDIPLHIGIMPITDLARITRFSAMCGADIPRWLKRQLMAYSGDQASFDAFCADFLADLCLKLQAAGADGFHFYTLNKAKATSRILDTLNYEK